MRLASPRGAFSAPNSPTRQSGRQSGAVRGARRSGQRRKVSPSLGREVCLGSFGVVAARAARAPRRALPQRHRSVASARSAPARAHRRRGSGASRRSGRRIGRSQTTRSVGGCARAGAACGRPSGTRPAAREQGCRFTQPATPSGAGARRRVARSAARPGQQPGALGLGRSNAYRAQRARRGAPNAAARDATSRRGRVRVPEQRTRCRRSPASP